MNKVAAVHQKFCGTEKYFHCERGTNGLTGQGHRSPIWTSCKWKHCIIGSLALSSDFSFMFSSALNKKYFSFSDCHCAAEGTSFLSMYRQRERCACSMREMGGLGGGSVSVRTKQLNSWCFTETWQDRTCLWPMAAGIGSSKPRLKPWVQNGFRDGWTAGWMCYRQNKHKLNSRFLKWQTFLFHCFQIFLWNL